MSTRTLDNWVEFEFTMVEAMISAHEQMTDARAVAWFDNWNQAFEFGKREGYFRAVCDHWLRTHKT
jgi:hypothetical protein